MSVITRGIILVIFLIVIFGQSLFPSRALYWSAYFVLFSLVPLLWFFNFWVSKSGALNKLKESGDYGDNISKDDIKNSIFVGMIPINNNDDLIRGRLCFVNGNVVLVGRKGRKSDIKWEAKIEDIKSVGFGVVAGVRKGFTIYLKDDAEKSFTCMKVYKNRDVLYNALGWEIKITSKDTSSGNC